MEKLAASKSSTVLTWGLYLGIASIVFGLIQNYGGLLGNTYFRLLWYVIVIVMLVLGIKNYKEKQNDGFVKYSQGLGIGTLIGLIGGVVYGVFNYVFFTIIDPSVHAKFIAMAQENALEQGATEASLEQAEGIMNFMFNPVILSIIVIITTMFWAFVFSLIISAILKKDPEPEF
ncbi:DUF4199 domain-containing protein [Plebeiibacterium sediminum]|uniref:DUF4199 domain-containing protein n=1 Tax=Plebeiibacterium sediminum TaxID=2992112 RepID=A0AAE3M8W1_9BACT|nr:DUF4199 domain-containing protein [Plebeiobacterium sediminum]MCW3789054.1 DUF4199 domain-containing protein [Plebeiobacterium sediminum]